MGKSIINFSWGLFVSRCFEMMVEDEDLEVLKLLSSTSAKIAQGEVLQLQHKGEADLLEETYLEIINLKTASFLCRNKNRRMFI